MAGGAFCPKSFRFEDVASQPWHDNSVTFMRRFQAATGDKPLHYPAALTYRNSEESAEHHAPEAIKTISNECRL